MVYVRQGAFEIGASCVPLISHKDNFNGVGLPSHPHTAVTAVFRVRVV